MQPDAACQQSDARTPQRKIRKSAVQVGQDLAYKALRSKGLTQEATAKALGLHPSSGSRIEARIKEAEGLTNGLLSPERDENAAKLIDHFINKGLAMKKVKGSDALGAVKLYTDRRWPAKAEAPGPQVSFVQINVDTIRMDTPFDPSNPQSTPIDITPQPSALPDSVGNE